MSEDHQCAVDCQERMCYRSADYSLCDRHYDQKLKDARDAERDVASDAVERVMNGWEGVVDIDNPVSLEGLKKELLEAISP